MNDRPVRSLLQQLHTTLGDTRTISEEDRELLRQLSDDIQAVLERSGEGKPASLAGRLRAAVTRFEVSHPDLTAAMAQVSKQLGDMGI